MKKILFYGLFVYAINAFAVGFDVGYPGIIVDSSSDSSLTKRQDRLLTVPINIIGKNGKVSRCTGTLIGDKYVLTAKHCLYPAIPSQLINHYVPWNLYPTNSINVSVSVYSSFALSGDNIQAYGGVYRFSLIRNDINNFLAFSGNNSPIPAVNYQTMSVSKIAVAPVGSDMAILVLGMVPEIVVKGVVNPKENVTFISSKEFVNGLWNLVNGHVEFFTSPGELNSRYAEIMGFGIPKNTQGNSIDPQINMNRRSSVGGFANIFYDRPLPADTVPDPELGRPVSQACYKNCFIYTFAYQPADEKGDSGAAFYDLIPEHSVPGKKVISGIVSAPVELRWANRVQDSLQTLAISTTIQGITQEDISWIKHIREQ